VIGYLLLLPQGSRLIGSYDSVVAFGQSRALLVWQANSGPESAVARDSEVCSNPNLHTILHIILA
jgi:type IV secretion system protein TrbI